MEKIKTITVKGITHEIIPAKATEAEFGGIKAKPATEQDNQEVHITSEGNLVTSTGFDLIITQAQLGTFMQKGTVNLPYVAIPKSIPVINIKLEDGSLLSSVSLTLHMSQGNSEIRIFGATVIDDSTANTLTNMNLYVEDIAKTIRLNTASEPVVMGQATANKLGGIKAVPSTKLDFKEIKIDESTGKLYTDYDFTAPEDISYFIFTPDAQNNAFTLIGTIQEPIYADWGDGSPIETITSSITHIYVEPFKEITLKIKGLIDDFIPNKNVEKVNLGKNNIDIFSNRLNSCHKLKVIDGLDTSKSTEMAATFQYCDNLTAIPTDIDTSKVTTMNRMFDGCSNLNFGKNNQSIHAGFDTIYIKNSISEMPQLNTQQVTNTEYMFNNCESLTRLPSLNMSNVVNMNGMFNGCSSLREIPVLNTAKVSVMNNVFTGCTSLNAIAGLNTSGLKSTASLFKQCSALDSIPELDTAQVTDMNNMFNGCSSLRGLTVLDTNKTTNLSYLFNDCNSLTSVPQLDTSKATDMSYMFNNCSSLEAIPAIDCTSCTNISHMFDNTKIKKIELTNCNNINGTMNSYFENNRYLEEILLDNLSKITRVWAGFENCKNLQKAKLTGLINCADMHDMFRNCSSLTTVTLTRLDKCEDLGYAFDGCTNLAELTISDTSHVTHFESIFRDCSSFKNIPNLNTTNGKYMSEMFKNCFSLTKIPVLDTGQAVSVSSMFEGCKLIETAPNLNLLHATNINYIFKGCSSLKNSLTFDLPSVITAQGCFADCTLLGKVTLTNTTNITSMRQMFKNCKNLWGASIADTSNVTNMEEMFSYCTNLVNSPKLNTLNVTSMSGMFNGCERLNSISNLENTDNVTNMSYIFKNCKALSSINKLNTSKVTNMTQAFYGCSSLTSLPALDFSECTNIKEMFFDTKLKKVTILNCNKLKDASWLLRDIKELTEVSITGNTMLTSISGICIYCPNLERVSLPAMADKCSTFWPFNGCVNLVFLEIPRITADLDLQPCKKLPREVLVNLFMNLVQQPEGTTKNFYLGQTLLDKLTEDDKLIATNKGWTLK